MGTSWWSRDYKGRGFNPWLQELRSHVLWGKNVKRKEKIIQVI